MNFITSIASLRKQQLLNCATWNLERAEQASRNGETAIPSGLEGGTVSEHQPLPEARSPGVILDRALANARRQEQPRGDLSETLREAADPRTVIDAATGGA